MSGQGKSGGKSLKLAGRSASAVRAGAGRYSGAAGSAAGMTDAYRALAPAAGPSGQEAAAGLGQLLRLGASGRRRRALSGADTRRKAAETRSAETRRGGGRGRPDQDSRNRCTDGDPVDMVTGSFLIGQCDFIINDITGVRAVERTYESVLAGEDSPVGRGWTLSLFSRVLVCEGRAEVGLPDGHTETFLKTAGGYRSRRGGGRRLELLADGDGFLLREAGTGLARSYGADGRQLCVTDRNGNRTQYRYEGETLVKIVFASGQYLDFSWKGNRIVSATDCIGRRVTYRYDGDFLTEVCMPNGGVESYAYDSLGRITGVTDANGVTYVHNEYDGEGRVTRQTLCNGQEYLMNYADDERTNTWLVPAGRRETRHVYNRQMQLIRTEYQDGTTEEMEYDSWGNRILERNRRGGVTRRGYDEYGRLLREEQPGGLVVTREYDGDGNCIRVSDNAGAETVCSYDRNGNLIRREERTDRVNVRAYSYEYDRHGRVTAETGPNGGRDTYGYDTDYWDPTVFVTSEGDRYEHGLDRAGRCVTVTGADGIREYAYNHFDLVCMERDPMGNTTRYRYDRTANLTAVVRPNHSDPDDGRGETYAYDAFHNRTMRTDATGAVFATPRDGEGNIAREISPNARGCGRDDGECVSYVRDGHGRRIMTRYPDGGTERRWYDASGNLVRVCLPEQYDEAADDGEGFAYEYDSMDRLVQVTAPDGTVRRRYVYDLHGNMVKSVSASGMRTGSTDGERTGSLYAYNAAGWLTERRVPVSEDGSGVKYQLTRYGYDRAGNLVREQRYLDYQTLTGASGAVHTISYEYDTIDRLVRVSDCTGAEIRYAYDSCNRRVLERQKISDTVDRTLRYRYDAAGRMVELVRTADPSGCGRREVSVRFTYDRNGNQTSARYPSGAETLREYDAADRLVLERHRDGRGGIDRTTRFAYDAAGNMVRVTDSRGRETRITYDMMNRAVRRTECDGSVTAHFYDRNGRLVRTVRPREYGRAGEAGRGEQYTYDAEGRVLTAVRADGTVLESRVYDEEGRLVRTLDGTGRGITYRYDIGGRRTSEETAGKAVRRYEYDPFGNRTAVVDGAGNRTEYGLDKWGRTVRVGLPDGSGEYYAYDHAGNMTRSTDGEGNTTVYEYIGPGLMSALTDPLGGRETYAYDAEERVCRKTDRNGVVTEYAYNMFGSLLERRAGRLCERYAYSADGLLERAGGYRYVRDAAGRPVGKESGGRMLLELEYDGNGNLARQTDMTGKVTEYRYDVCDRITDVVDDGVSVAQYGYNADGTVRSLRCGPLFTEYAYDADRNLSGLRTMLGEEVLADNVYAYDGNGNRTEKRQAQGLTSYTYDSRNRLVRAEYPDRTEELRYDRAGNRTARIRTAAGRGGTEARGGLPEEEYYRYDGANRLVRYETGGRAYDFSYDRAGNLLRDDRAAYVYDAFRRNVRTETPGGNAQASRYDAEGLRCGLEENGSACAFVWRGDEAVAEESQAGVVRHVRADRLLASVPGGEPAENRRYYAADETGSITHVADGRTGRLLESYEYDAWGNLMSGGVGTGNRFRYGGEQFDAVSGKYYLRSRYYDPVTGRFTQEDTWRGDGLNLYDYCAGNPVNYADPEGTKACRTGSELLRGDPPEKADGSAGKSDKKYYDFWHDAKYNKVTDYVNGGTQKVKGDRKMYSVENGRGGTIVVSNKSIDGDDFKNTLDHYSEQGKEVVILSGTHGTYDGKSAMSDNEIVKNVCTEEKFYRQDVKTAREYKNVKVVNVGNISREEFDNYIKSDKVVVCAWCYSDRSDDIIQSLPGKTTSPPESIARPAENAKKNIYGKKEKSRDSSFFWQPPVIW